MCLTMFNKKLPVTFVNLCLKFRTLKIKSASIFNLRQPIRLNQNCKPSLDIIDPAPKIYQANRYNIFELSLQFCLSLFLNENNTGT